MALRMARPVRRTNSSVLYFRQRIPRDLLTRVRGTTLLLPVGSETVRLNVGPKAEDVKLSLRTRDPTEAKQLQSQVLAHLGRVWQGLRDGPKRLTRKEIVALAGEHYRDVIQSLEAEPGEPAIWDHVLRLQDQAVQAGKIEQWTGPAVDELLAQHGLTVDDYSRDELVKEIHRTFTQIARVLRRHADGDYRADPDAVRFPRWIKPDGNPKPSPTSLTNLVELWWAEMKLLGLAPKTYESYAATFRKFAAFLETNDAGQVTPDDVIRFKDHRLASGIKPRTIKDVDLAALKSVFGWAVDNKKLKVNPAEGVKLKVPSAQKAKNRGFTDEEAIALLRAAWNRPRGKEKPTTYAAYRWVPWLCAYTGARVGEMVQLRKQDVVQREGVWFVEIDPEAGTVKGGKRRSVPLHPHLIELGFPSFASTSETDYLFISPRADGNVRGPSQGIKNRLSDAARETVPDRSVQPNHGWRHRLVTLSRKYGLDQELRRMITGHAGQGVDEIVYGEPAGLYREICKLPRYEID